MMAPSEIDLFITPLLYIFRLIFFKRKLCIETLYFFSHAQSRMMLHSCLSDKINPPPIKHSGYKKTALTL